MKSLRIIIIFSVLALFFIFSPACKEGLPVEEIAKTIPEVTKSETKNNIPEIENLKILPDNPNTSQDLTLSYEFNDPDNDPDKSVIKWYKNNEYVSVFDNITIISRINLDAGDSWYAVISPYDGTDYGENITSEEIIISKGNIDPIIVGNIAWTNESSPIFMVEGNFLYIFYGIYDKNWNIEESILQIMDVSDKNSPETVGSLEFGPINFGGFTDKMFIKDNYAYFEYFVYDENWNSTSGIKIINLSLKENPQLIDTIEFDGEIYGFYVNEQGDNIYVLDNKCNLNIFSLNDDGKFTINNKIKLPIKKTSRVLYIIDNYAVVPYWVDHYYSIYDAGIQIVDIADGGNIRVLSDLSLPGQFTADIRYLDSDYLILGESESIHIFDISDKNAPRDLSRIELPSLYSPSYIKDDILYSYKRDSAYDKLYAKGEFTSEEFDSVIPNNDGSIQIIDLKNKEAPLFLYSFDTGDIINPSKFFEENNYLYFYYDNPDNYGTDGILIIKLY